METIYMQWVLFLTMSRKTTLTDDSSKLVVNPSLGSHAMLEPTCPSDLDPTDSDVVQITMGSTLKPPSPFAVSHLMSPCHGSLQFLPLPDEPRVYRTFGKTVDPLINQQNTPIGIDGGLSFLLKYTLDDNGTHQDSLSGARAKYEYPGRSKSLSWRLIAGSIVSFGIVPAVHAAWTMSRGLRVASGITSTMTAIAVVPLRTADHIPQAAWIA